MSPFFFIGKIKRKPAVKLHVQNDSDNKKGSYLTLESNDINMLGFSRCFFYEDKKSFLFLTHFTICCTMIFLW